MAGTGNRPLRSVARMSATGADEESTAAGIYGVVVSAAVMAASHHETIAALELAVLVTVLIYWGAERYARLVAERIHAGHRLNAKLVRARLAAGWEMVTASLAPLALLAVMGILGFSFDVAVLAALAFSTFLLGLAGWEIGKNGRLNYLERIASATVAAAFGGFFILLKALLH